MRLDLDFDHGGLFCPRKQPEGCPTDRAVLLRRAEGRDFFHYWEWGTVPAAVPWPARLLPPLSGAGRLGLPRTVGACRFFTLGAVQALLQVADRGLTSRDVRLQGCFSLHQPLVLCPPVVRLPFELDIGLFCQHHRLLGKRRGLIPVHRRQLRGRYDVGEDTFHGLRYINFIWKVPVFSDERHGLIEYLPFEVVLGVA